MPIKTFWTILLKILGICLLFQGLTLIQQLFSLLFIQPILDSGGYFLSLLVSLAIYLIISFCLIFRANWLIESLKLEKGLEEEIINLNVNSSAILNIAIIVLGAVVIMGGLPALFQQVTKFFQQQNMFKESPVTNWIIFYCIKIALGWLMLIKSKQITTFFCKEADENH